MKARQGSVDGVPLAAQMQAEEVPEVRKGCAAQAFGGRGQRWGATLEKKKAENRTVERLGGTARGPGPRPSHLTWRPVGVQV